MLLWQQIFSLLLRLLTQSNANLSQMPFWPAVGYCMLHWDFKLSCQYRICLQLIQCHTDMSESQMAQVNTEPLDISWSSRDGSVSIEFMLQAELRCKEVRFPERFFFGTESIPDIGLHQWRALHYCRGSERVEVYLHPILHEFMLNAVHVKYIEKRIGKS